MKCTTYLALIGLILAPSVWAEDDPFGDDFNAGFDSVETDAPEERSLYWAHRLFTGGQFNVQHSAPDPGATDHRGLSSLTTGWQPRLEWRPSSALSAELELTLQQDWVFALKSDSAQWQDDYREARETQLKLDEAALRYQTLGWAASIGKQTLAWGFNDVLSVNEPVNPPQRSQPGLQDPDNALLPRWLSEARLYLADWTVQAVVALDNPMAEQPVYGSDYYPLPFAIDDQTPESPAEDVSTLSGGVRVSGLAAGADVAAFVWRGYHSSGHLVGSAPNLQRQYERLTQLGAGLSVPVQAVVVKAELRWEDGLAYGNNDTTERLAWTLGADLSLPADSRLIVEHQSRFLPDYQATMASIGDEYEQQWALGLEHSRWNDRLTLKALMLGFGDWDDGQVMRLSADWALSDHWQTEAGWVVYRDGDAALASAAADNDRLYWQVDYRF